MATLHQLTCFLQVYDAGSLTGAAERMGYAQPSISEQIRTLEKSVGTQLFIRAGRGVVPTSAADEMRPHAERALAAADDAMRAARSVTELEAGTIRFGMFGTARHYASAGLVSDVLERHPNVRVELVGQNSSDVMDDLRRGRIEAAMIALPQVASEGMHVVPVARDEMVYVSADPERISTPVTAPRLGRASLVMAETTYRAVDSSRIALRQMLHEVGINPVTRVEVEDVETAIELTGRGLVDTVVQLGIARQVIPALAPNAGWVSLRPKTYDTLAIVHRTGASLSPAARLMVRLATQRIREVTEPTGPPDPLG